MSKQDSDLTALACDLTALNAQERKRYDQVREQMEKSREEVRGVANGYVFRYPAESTVFLLLAEFISLESRCCPFLSFALEVAPQHGPAWLTLTGPEGGKEFLRAELGIDHG